MAVPAYFLTVSQWQFQHISHPVHWWFIWWFNHEFHWVALKCSNKSRSWHSLSSGITTSSLQVWPSQGAWSTSGRAQTAQNYWVSRPFLLPLLPQNQHCPIWSSQDNSGIRKCQIMFTFVTKKQFNWDCSLTKRIQVRKPPVFSSHRLSCLDLCKLHSDHWDHGDRGVVINGDLPSGHGVVSSACGVAVPFLGPGVQIYIYIYTHIFIYIYIYICKDI